MGRAPLRACPTTGAKVADEGRVGGQAVDGVEDGGGAGSRVPGVKFETGIGVLEGGKKIDSVAADFLKGVLGSFDREFDIKANRRGQRARRARGGSNGAEGNARLGAGARGGRVEGVLSAGGVGAVGAWRSRRRSKDKRWTEGGAASSSEVELAWSTSSTRLRWGGMTPVISMSGGDMQEAEESGEGGRWSGVDGGNLGGGKETEAAGSARPCLVA